MDQVICWHDEGNLLWADGNGIRLIVHPHTTGGYARFVLLDYRTANGHSGTLIGSGTHDDVATAKRVAEKMAMRLSTEVMRSSGWAASSDRSRTHRIPTDSRNLEL
jgi:hypothetical protein